MLHFGSYPDLDVDFRSPIRVIRNASRFICRSINGNWAVSSLLDKYAEGSRLHSL